MKSKLSALKLIQLKESVVSDFDSSNWRELGVLTNTLEDVERHSRLLRSLSWGDDDYDGLALIFPRKMIGQNDENLNTVRTYINQVCDTSGENISSELTIGKKIVFKPTRLSWGQPT